jgi:hypothetical protein
MKFMVSHLINIPQRRGGAEGKDGMPTKQSLVPESPGFPEAT